MYLRELLSFLIEQVVNYLVANKTASIEQLQGLVQCYNYGYLAKRSIPSKLNIEKKHRSKCNSITMFVFAPAIHIIPIQRPAQSHLVSCRVIAPNRTNSLVG